MSPGCTRTFSRPVPWTPDGVPPVEAPWMRSQIAVIERVDVQLGVLDEHRRRGLDVADALVLERRLRRNLEQDLPDDVARVELPRLRCELLAGRRRVVRVVVLGRHEGVEQPLHAADAQLQRLGRMIAWPDGAGLVRRAPVRSRDPAAAGR